MMLCYMLVRWRCFFVLSVFFQLYGLAAVADPGLRFIENKNQWAAAIDFKAHVPGGDVSIQPGRFRYAFIDGQRLEALHDQSHSFYSEADDMPTVNNEVRGHCVEANFLGANAKATPAPFGRLNTYYNYFRGSDSSRWASKAYAYTGVFYSDFYKGIDVKVYSVGQHMKYDYMVAPMADPSQIIVQYDGAENLYVSNGDLYVVTSLGEMIEKKPYAFQFICGKKVTVPCQYELSNNRVSFCFPGGYDPCYELTIDPLLIFSTYSGSTADNWGSTATPGEHGTLYSAGVTSLVDLGGKFPATVGAFQVAYGGLYDIGILKYDSTGAQLLYATYLGGTQSESPHSLVVNSDQELVVLGTTSSSDFPTGAGAIDRGYNGGEKVSHVVEYTMGSDIFVARISKDGSQLLASTYLGGSNNDGLNVLEGGLVKNYGDHLRGDVITDADGNIYISSVTSSVDFPVAGGFDNTYNAGYTDAILVKLNASLSRIVWGTYIGGSRTDAAHTLKIDSDGNIFIAGGTSSIDFPATPGAYKATLQGQQDGWIAKVDSTGNAILAATFTGTTAYDQVYFLDLNKSNEVYVYGQTTGSFPTSPGVYKNVGSGQFVQKLNSTLSATVFSTVFGSGRGIPDISPTAFLVSACDNVYMAGWGGLINSMEGFWQSNTLNMPVTPDALQKTTSGSDFYFISLTADASQFLYGTYLGGTQSRTHVDGGTSRFDKSGIVYQAVCSGCEAFNAAGPKSTSDFPTTAGVWSRTNNSKNCNNAAFKLDLSILKARLQTNSVNFTTPGLNKVCIPDKIAFQNKSIGGETFRWDFGDGTIITKADTSAIFYQYKKTGRYKVKLKVIDLSTCVGVDSTETFVDVLDTQAKAQDDDIICAGSTYTLKASGGVLYNWTSATDTTFHASQPNPTIAPQDTSVYYVEITAANGCMVTDTVSIGVIPKLALDFAVTFNTDCFSRPSITLQAAPAEEQSNGIVFFDFGDGQTSDLDRVSHAYAADGYYRVKRIGQREFCGFEKEVNVPAFTIKVPNVITPGSSPGFNDTFVIQFGETAGITPADYGLQVSLSVYDRWGVLVYRSNDYKNDWAGEGVTPAVYYYNVTIDGVASCKNWVQIIK